MATPPSKMLVEQDPHQTRVAVLESDDRLAELYIERQGARGGTPRPGGRSRCDEPGNATAPAGGTPAGGG